MDHPFLVGFIVLAVAAAIGYTVEQYVWAKALAALATVALIAAAYAQLLR